MPLNLKTIILLVIISIFKVGGLFILSTSGHFESFYYGGRIIRGADLIYTRIQALAQSLSPSSEAAKYLNIILELLSHRNPAELLEEKLFRIQGLKVISVLPLSENEDLIKLAIDELVYIAKEDYDLFPEEKIKIQKSVIRALSYYPFINNEYEKKILDILSEHVQSENPELRKETAEALKRRALLDKNNSPQSLYPEVLRDIFSLFADVDNQVRIKAIEAIGTLDITDEVIIAQLKKIANRNFSRWITLFHVRPSQVEEAGLVAEATIALMRLKVLDKKEFRQIIERFYALQDGVVKELYRTSGINHVSFQNRVNNLKEVTIIFYRLLETLRDCNPDDSNNIQVLGSRLVKMQAELEKIFGLEDILGYGDEETSLIAAQGLVRTEWILDLDFLLELSDVTSWTIAVPAIDILKEFVKYYPQAKEEIFTKLTEYLTNDLSPIRIAAAEGLADILMVYFPPLPS